MSALTVNGQPASAGCYVDGHWGQYAGDHLADRLEGFGLTIDKNDDPRRFRRIADWLLARTGYRHTGTHLNNLADTAREGHSESADDLIERANDVTDGGYWEWHEGEVFLRSYVCSECGRDAQDPAADLAIDLGGRGYAGPCDYCCDADDPGAFAD